MEHPLGEYAKCPWCGAEHYTEDGTSKGWAITEVYFDRDAFVDTTSRQKPNEYLCDSCAELAAHAPQMLQVLKYALADIDYLLREGFDVTPAECEIEGVKDTIHELASLIARLDPNGETFVNETDWDLLQTLQEDDQ